jgi:hypothetical protein
MSFLGNIFGAVSGAASGLNPLAAAKAQAAKAGFSPALFDEIAAEMKTLASKGLTQQQMMEEAKKLFVAKGLPAQAVDMAMAMAQKKLGLRK